MRTLLTAALLISVFYASAQVPVSLGFSAYPQNLFWNNNPQNLLNKKWSVTTYSAISTGLLYYNGSASNFVAAPIGLQLNRQLNKNFYAFAGVSVVPAYIHSTNYFLSSDVSKPYPGNIFNVNSFGVSPMAQMGLMYVNDDKTFSISGSISVQRGGYYYPQQTPPPQNNTLIKNR
ncbi:MAG: hypothetical protein JST96_11165 [Bacteroidetes bacterium]|nr:hypothetical protein [Bacteroidota bacterium]